MASENICLKRSSKPRRSCDSISILVVDDDTTCLAVVAALLKKFKYSGSQFASFFNFLLKCIQLILHE